MGRHRNRGRLFDARGHFLAALPISSAERLVDFGHARRLSGADERPMRIQLRSTRPWQPKPLTPTSGCTTPAAITAKDAMLYVYYFGKRSKALTN